MRFLKSFVLFIAFVISTNCYSQILSDLQLSQQTIFTSIDEALEDPDHVYILNIRYSPKIIDPSDLLIFKNLQGLDIEVKIELDTFPGVLKNLKKLQWISIVNNNIRVLTNDMMLFKYLNSLDLSSNKISELPNFNMVNTTLTVLNLDNNSLEYIPSGISNFTSLKSLSIADNKITKLPIEVCDLDSLIYFDIMYNKIYYLPDSINKLSNSLERINVNGNGYTLDYCLWIKKQLPDTKVYIHDKDGCVRTYNELSNKFSGDSLKAMIHHDSIFKQYFKIDYDEIK